MAASRWIVIGGGITGLTAAYRLREGAARAGRPLDVLCLEADARPGGHARTRCEDGFVVEEGPNGFLDSPRDPVVSTLARDLGIAERLAEGLPESKRRFICLGGRLRLVPEGPGPLVSSDLLSPAGKLRLLLEPLARRAPADREETVFEFAARRVGREAAEALIDTAVSGISGGDSRQLAVAAAFPLMTEMERDYGSLIVAMMKRGKGARSRLLSFDTGLGALTEALSARLGPALRLGARVAGLARGDGGWRVRLEDGDELAADGVVLSLPARSAAPVVEPLDPGMAGAFREFPTAGLAVVGLAYRRADVAHPLNGYGYLVARREGLDTLGVVWESSLFPGRAPQERVLLRAILGGVSRPQVMDLSEGALAQRARDELARVLGITATPVQVWTARWPHAITQYTVGHPARVARVRALAERHPGLEICGSAYDGISFSASVASGEKLAVRVLDGLAAPAAGVRAGPAAAGDRSAQPAARA
jgi:oxygen-dependent protoporphyrinogen oxidase